MSALDPMFLQYGALGILLLVLFFAGQIAKLFVQNAMKNQERLIDGTLQQMRELATEINDNTKSTTELAKAIQALNQSIAANSKDVSDEHRAMIDGLKRLGGFRPSSDRDQPAVRPSTYRRTEREPDSR